MKKNASLFNHTAAGILPIIKMNDTIYFLLGREKHGLDFDKSGKFSDFGGHKDLNETPEETAIREFDEESMGVLYDKNKLKGIISTLPKYINKKYNYIIFLLKIDYKPDIINTYNTILKKLQTCEGVNKKSLPRCNNGLLEKTEFKLFKVHNILKNKKILRKEFISTFKILVKEMK